MSEELKRVEESVNRMEVKLEAKLDDILNKFVGLTTQVNKVESRTERQPSDACKLEIGEIAKKHINEYNETLPNRVEDILSNIKREGLNRTNLHLKIIIGIFALLQIAEFILPHIGG